MSLVLFKELYEPWHIDDDEAKLATWPREAQIPEDLLARFITAKAEMESVWAELRKLRMVAA